MAKKQAAPPHDGALVTAAKAIGAAAGKLALAVGVPHAPAAPPPPDPPVVKKKTARKAKSPGAPRAAKKAAKKA
jgi:hypothetical protein